VSFRSRGKQEDCPLTLSSADCPPARLIALLEVF
jgi:hypothetical protein